MRFPLLPAFLSDYPGAYEDRRRRRQRGSSKGLVVGGLVAIGFLGLFAVVGLPVSQASGRSRMPFRGLALATGVVLALSGLGVVRRPTDCGASDDAAADAA